MRFLRALPLVFFIIMLFVMMLLKPIDRSPIEGSDLLRKAMDSVRQAEVYAYSDSLPLSVAYGRVNITPSYKMPMAGYTPRSAFSSVHDSLYVHIVLIEKEDLDLYFISADLLIFPDELRDRLESAFSTDDNTHLYLSASHTHSGLGGWADGIGGQLIAGKYHPEWIRETTSSILKKMEQIRDDSQPSTISYFETDASEYVKNRLVRGAPVDGVIRGLKIRRSSQDSLILFTYSGHPTLLDQHSTELSNDYPGATIQQLEDHGYRFAMFMAGMMGSHRITNIEGKGYDRVKNVADMLTSRIVDAEGREINAEEIRLLQFKIPFRPSQVRLMDELAVRNWIFSSLLAPLKGSLTMLRIGDLHFISTPCDFSGELYTDIDTNVKPAVITSFNGDYIGYITKDIHYDSSSYMEVRTMNWVGPYYGSYFTDLMNTAAKRIN